MAAAMQLLLVCGVACAAGAGAPPHTHIRHPTNLTVYHSAPPCAGPGVADRDTGDVFGDLYFVVRAIMTPLECVPDPPHKARCGNHSCTNPEDFGPGLLITKGWLGCRRGHLQQRAAARASRTPPRAPLVRCASPGCCSGKQPLGRAVLARRVAVASLARWNRPNR